jgi:hypothetical protein
VVHIKAVIEGSTPLLIHKFTDEAQLEATGGTRVSTVGNRGTPLEQATAALHVDSKNRPIVPANMLYGSIVNGGAYFKAGRTKVTTQKTSLLYSCFEINEMSFLIEHREPWTVDTRPVRIPTTGGRILRHRALFNDWLLRWSGKLDEAIMTISLLRDIVDVAGVRAGIGDYRPACKGPFGKYRIVEWKVERTNGTGA